MSTDVKRAIPLELFFDLVFVFAITQIVSTVLLVTTVLLLVAIRIEYFRLGSSIRQGLPRHQAEEWQP